MTTTCQFAEGCNKPTWQDTDFCDIHGGNPLRIYTGTGQVMSATTYFAIKGVTGAMEFDPTPYMEEQEITTRRRVMKEPLDDEPAHQDNQDGGTK